MFVHALVIRMSPIFNAILYKQLLTYTRKPCVPDTTYNSSVLRWEWSPNPGALSNRDVGKYLRVSSGVDIWYTTMGPAHSKHTPVLILHGGTGNSNQMYNQANMLADTRLVILQE